MNSSARHLSLRGSLRLCGEPYLRGVFEAAALTVEKGLATVKQRTIITANVLKMGVGPFTAHNLTGGNPPHPTWPQRDEYQDHAMVQVP